MTEFLIKDSEIAQSLNISRQKLLNIRRKLNLVPQTDYIKLSASEACFYTTNGIQKLYNALQASPPYRPKARLLKALVHNRKQQALHALIRQTVLENSQIVKINNINFLPEDKVATILKIRLRTLNKTFEAVQKTPSPLTHETEFRRIEEVTYYSFSGIGKLSEYLAENHNNSTTRTWCKNVTIHTKSVEKDTASSQNQRINQAKNRAKARDNNTCQITQEKQTIDSPIPLAVHHLYDQTHYPHLADSLDNLLTIKESIHKEFHQYQGGTSKPCTIEDFARFIQLAYPEYPDALNTLHRFRKRLCTPQPLTLAQLQGAKT
ncbi:hypothetical protein L3556_14730 [Candidatus Synechococcus calcipolaris G9]|uniref:HNH nuclease domain-containing protein n=1 Tax=Candidatus Synechococcus calcipolaris G9 TaxID=1497997 RepID=A0ABT6F308_9SYNE|nr:hypothetical protein [Candidatus Synechococcus calcipolaris]MDG2992173.1 hypothetical protein [Candidatus Synechococcus calcipolaris G9]